MDQFDFSTITDIKFIEKIYDEVNDRLKAVFHFKLTDCDIYHEIYFMINPNTYSAIPCISSECSCSSKDMLKSGMSKCVKAFFEKEKVRIVLASDLNVKEMLSTY